MFNKKENESKVEENKSGWGSKEKKVKMTHIDEIWDTLDEIQEDITQLSNQINKVLTRLGLE